LRGKGEGEEVCAEVWDEGAEDVEPVRGEEVEEDAFAWDALFLN
jgi:hypothetical protein